MVKVLDMFEDLKNCYSENEEDSFFIDYLFLNQKFFYDVSYDLFYEGCMDQFVFLSIYEIFKIFKLIFKQSMVVVLINGKVLKKRWLSLSQFIIDNNLEVIVNNLEEEIIKFRLVFFSFLSNVKYNFIRIIKYEFILNDVFN